MQELPKWSVTPHIPEIGVSTSIKSNLPANPSITLEIGGCHLLML